MKKLVEGKIIVLGGDFRLILHVVRKGSMTDIMKTIVISSPIWKNWNVLKSAKNMRLNGKSTNQSSNEIKEFANWILKIRDGDMESDEYG